MRLLNRRQCAGEFVIALDDFVPKSAVSGFLRYQRLATRKCETLVYTPRFSWRRLIKWHTIFVTTDSCARRSPEPPGFSFQMLLRQASRHALERVSFWDRWRPAGLCLRHLVADVLAVRKKAGKMPAVLERNSYRRRSTGERTG